MTPDIKQTKENKIVENEKDEPTEVVLDVE